MNKLGETERRRHNLESLYEEYSWFINKFMENGSQHYFRRGTMALSRYKWLFYNPLAVRSK